jgi:hypothetical protein
LGRGFDGAALRNVHLRRWQSTAWPPHVRGPVRPWLRPCLPVQFTTVIGTLKNKYGKIQRAVAQLARVPVSKTGGWGFESLLPCECGTGAIQAQFGAVQVRK